MSKAKYHVTLFDYFSGDSMFKSGLNDLVCHTQGGAGEAVKEMILQLKNLFRKKWERCSVSIGRL